MKIAGINKLRAKSLLARAGAANPGLTDREIAARLGISRGRVYQLHLRAIAKIRLAVASDSVLRELAEEVCGREIDEVLPLSAICTNARGGRPPRNGTAEPPQ